jgi:L-fuculose-phosphate aldolase
VEAKEKEAPPPPCAPGAAGEGPLSLPRQGFAPSGDPFILAPAWGPRQKVPGEATRHGRPKETGNKGIRGGACWLKFFSAFRQVGGGPLSPGAHLGHGGQLLRAHQGRLSHHPKRGAEGSPHPRGPGGGAPRGPHPPKGASVESVIHREVYRKTPARAIVHAHPRVAVALSLHLKSLVPLDLEGQFYLKEVPVLSPKTVSATEEAARAVAEALGGPPGLPLKGPRGLHLEREGKARGGPPRGLQPHDHPGGERRDPLLPPPLGKGDEATPCWEPRQKAPGRLTRARGLKETGGQGDEGSFRRGQGRGGPWGTGPGASPTPTGFLRGRAFSSCRSSGPRRRPWPGPGRCRGLRFGPSASRMG